MKINRNFLGGGGTKQKTFQGGSTNACIFWICTISDFVIDTIISNWTKWSTIQRILRKAISNQASNFKSGEYIVRGWFEIMIQLPLNCMMQSSLLIGPLQWDAFTSSKELIHSFMNIDFILHFNNLPLKWIMQISTETWSRHRYRFLNMHYCHLSSLLLLPTTKTPSMAFRHSEKLKTRNWEEKCLKYMNRNMRSDSWIKKPVKFITRPRSSFSLNLHYSFQERIMQKEDWNQHSMGEINDPLKKKKINAWMGMMVRE